MADTRRTVRAGVAALALLTVAGSTAACSGGTGTGNTSTGDNGKADSTASSAPEPIVLGNVGTISGPLGERYGIMQKAVQAWADTVNENGGLGGRQVRVEVADDGNDPARHLQIVKDMVENKGVVAFVGVPSPNTLEESLDYIEDKGVPFIGGIVGEHPWGESPMLFPHAITGTDKARALVYTAAATGKKKYAFIGVDTHGKGHPGQHSIDEFVDGIQAGAGKEFGVDLVYKGEFELTAPDSEYARVCNGAKQAGADMMTILTDFNTQAKVIKVCERLGYKPTYVSTGTTTDQKLVDIVGAPMEGALGLSRTAPWMGDEPVDLKVWRQAMQKHKLPTNSNTLQAWASGRILEVAMMMRGSSAGELDSAAIADALRKINGADLRGLIAPLGFGTSASKPNPGTSCFWLLKVTNGTWAPTGDGRVCLPKKPYEEPDDDGHDH